MDLLEVVHDLSMEFETPHTDWASRYARGEISVLFFSEGRGTRAREIIELMQRFDLRAEAAYFSNIIDSRETHWIGDEEGHERIARLLEIPRDCYLFNAVAPAELPPASLQALTEGVEDGAGLVLISADAGPLLRPENRLESLPDFLEPAPEGCEAFTLGKGRALRLAGPPDLSYHPGWETEYDYWQEFLGRALLWASDREPATRLDLALDRVEFERGEPVSVRVRWEGDTAPLNIAARLRRQDGQTTALAPEQVAEPRGELALQIPVGRADRYHVDVWAKSEAGVEAWATTSFTVESPLRVRALELEHDWGEINEKIAGRAALTQPLTAGQALRVQVLDRRDRILAHTLLQPDGTEARFEFPIASWMPMLLRVEAMVVEKGAEVASEYAYFRVTRRHRDQFNFLVWDFPRGPVAPYAEESLARLGMTVQLSGGNPPLEVAAHDIAWVPYTTRIMAPHDEQGIMQPMCWNDEENAEGHVRAIADRYLEARQHGVFAYSLGDETVTRGGCAHPTCLDAYREFLRGEYRDLQALNASWKSTYQDFDQIDLSDPLDSDESQALERGEIARWYDRQAFLAANFVEFCQRFDAAFKRMDPEALTGFEGAGRMRDGEDFDLIVRRNGFWSPYPGPGDEILRSLAPPGFPRANWMGYARDAESLLNKYWRMITRGMTSVWWWRWDNVGRFHGLLAPHLGPFPAVRELFEDTQIVRDGLGDLLNRSTMVEDSIALLYSHPSAHANRIPPGDTYGTHTESHVAWHHAIRELGLQFGYITDRMLRLGESDPTRYRVLVLPQAEAIGPAEAEVLTRFVRDGGTLIADVRPGLYDAHCSAREAGALDLLFGVERTANQEADTVDANITCTLNNTAFDLELPALQIDPGIRAAGATPLCQVGDTPLLLTHRLGDGQAILLNFSMASFPDPGARTTPEPAAAFIRQLFAAARVEPSFALQAPDGARARNVELSRWRNGDMDLIALFPASRQVLSGIAVARTETPEREITVTLPRASHVYDLRQRRYLGRQERFSAAILPGRASFFALTREPMPEPHLELSVPSASPGETITARLQIPDAAGLHALRIRVETPAGEPADWLHQVVLAGRRTVEIPLPIAFNDPPGEWTIRAIDLFTDRAAIAALQVR